MQILCELDDATADVPDGTVERSKVLLEAQSECEASEQRVKLPCTLRQWRTWAHGEYVQHIQDLDHVLAVLKLAHFLQADPSAWASILCIGVPETEVLLATLEGAPAAANGGVNGQHASAVIDLTEADSDDGKPTDASGCSQQADLPGLADLTPAKRAAPDAGPNGAKDAAQPSKQHAGDARSSPSVSNGASTSAAAAAAAVTGPAAAEAEMEAPATGRRTSMPWTRRGVRAWELLRAEHRDLVQEVLVAHAAMLTGLPLAHQLRTLPPGKHVPALCASLQRPPEPEGTVGVYLSDLCTETAGGVAVTVAEEEELGLVLDVSRCPCMDALAAALPHAQGAAWLEVRSRVEATAEAAAAQLRDVRAVLAAAAPLAALRSLRVAVDATVGEAAGGAPPRRAPEVVAAAIAPALAALTQLKHVVLSGDIDDAALTPLTGLRSVTIDRKIGLSWAPWLHAGLTCIEGVALVAAPPPAALPALRRAALRTLTWPQAPLALPVTPPRAVSLVSAWLAAAPALSDLDCGPLALAAAAAAARECLHTHAPLRALSLHLLVASDAPVAATLGAALAPLTQLTALHLYDAQPHMRPSPSLLATLDRGDLDAASHPASALAPHLHTLTALRALSLRLQLGARDQACALLGAPQFLPQLRHLRQLRLGVAAGGDAVDAVADRAAFALRGAAAAGDADACPALFECTLDRRNVGSAMPEPADQLLVARCLSHFPWEDVVAASVNDGADEVTHEDPFRVHDDDEIGTGPLFVPVQFLHFRAAARLRAARLRYGIDCPDTLRKVWLPAVQHFEGRPCIETLGGHVARAVFPCQSRLAGALPPALCGSLRELRLAGAVGVPGPAPAGARDALLASVAALTRLTRFELDKVRDLDDAGVRTRFRTHVGFSLQLVRALPATLCALEVRHPIGGGHAEAYGAAIARLTRLSRLALGGLTEAADDDAGLVAAVGAMPALCELRMSYRSVTMESEWLDAASGVLAALPCLHTLVLNLPGVQATDAAAAAADRLRSALAGACVRVHLKGGPAADN